MGSGDGTWASLTAALRAFFPSFDSPFRRAVEVATLKVSLASSEELEPARSCRIGSPVLLESRILPPVAASPHTERD